MKFPAWGHTVASPAALIGPMASVQARKNRAGDIISYRVKWRLGGTREGEWQSETFTDEPSARVFASAVEEQGHHWPLGWVKGRGLITPEDAADDERYRFRNFATRVIFDRTGIEEHYRRLCLRQLEQRVFPTFGDCDVRSAEHFSRETIRAWVRQLERTSVHKGPRPKSGEPKLRPMSPKTIRNYHGLLASVLKEAVTAEPPLRARNPCDLTVLPRCDDDGGVDGEDIEFLTPSEVDGLISCMVRRSDQLLARVKYGTGLRWSEVTALAPMCVQDADTEKPKIRVRRAWKRDGEKGYYLGPPKTRRSRRTLRVSSSVIEALKELGLQQLEHDALFFTGDRGQRLAYATFSARWHRAVRRAKESGLLSPEKRPTPHDLRHSHAAALISASHPLTYVQRRLGHESITTTSDTYGHLLPEADDNAMSTIEATLSPPRSPHGRLRSVG